MSIYLFHWLALVCQHSHIYKTSLAVYECRGLQAAPLTRAHQHGKLAEKLKLCIAYRAKTGAFMHGLRQEYDSRHRHGMLASSRSSSVAGSRPTTADSWPAQPHHSQIAAQPSQLPSHTSSGMSSDATDLHNAQAVSDSWPFAQSPIPATLTGHVMSQSSGLQQSQQQRHHSTGHQQANTGRAASDLHSATAVALMDPGVSLQQYQQTLSPIRTQQTISSSASTRSPHSQRISRRLASVPTAGNLVPGPQPQHGLSQTQQLQLMRLADSADPQLSPMSRARRVLYSHARVHSSGTVTQSEKLSAADTAASLVADVSRKARLLPSHFDLFDSESSSEEEDAEDQVQAVANTFHRSACHEQRLMLLRRQIAYICWLLLQACTRSRWFLLSQGITRQLPFLNLCVSSLREGHANILCIVPTSTDCYGSGWTSQHVCWS